MSSHSCLLTADDCGLDLLVHFGAEINYLGPSFSIFETFSEEFLAQMNGRLPLGPFLP